MAVVLRSKERLAETLLKQPAVGEACQVVVMCKIVNVIGAAAVLGYVPTGDGNAIADPDNLNVEPGRLDHLIVDEDLTGVWHAGAHDITVVIDQAGSDHEGANFGEHLAVEGFAGYAEPVLGIRVYVAEAKVDDGTRGIRNAIENIEVVYHAFGGGEKSGVVRGDTYTGSPWESRENGFEKCDNMVPKTLLPHTQVSARPSRDKWKHRHALYRCRRRNSSSNALSVTPLIETSQGDSSVKNIWVMARLVQIA